jgi:hypothetical protein
LNNHLDEKSFLLLWCVGTLVEELVNKLVKRLVDEKYCQKVSKIQWYVKEVLPSCVGRFAKPCREICHPV